MTVYICSEHGEKMVRNEPMLRYECPHEGCDNVLTDEEAFRQRGR